MRLTQPSRLNAADAFLAAGSHRHASSCDHARKLHLHPHKRNWPSRALASRTRISPTAQNEFQQAARASPPASTGKHLKQRAERILGIALSDRVVCAQAKQLSKTRAVEVAVVREDVHAAAQLARERLGVGKGAPTLRRPADVADHGTASVGMILSEAQAGAFARCERLLDKAHIAILVVGDSPTVFVWPVKAAVARELLQRCDDAEQRVQRRECHRSLRDSRQAGTLTPLQILLVLRGQAIAAGGDRLAEAGRVRRKLEDGRIACGARRLRDRGAARARRAGKFAAASRAPAG